MDFADLLLQAAVSWRGKPPLFTPRALGGVGDNFNMAFTDAPWSADSVSRSLAYEYFVGLIFNGDFNDLDGLVALVATWMRETRDGITLIDFQWGGRTFESPFTFGWLGPGFWERHSEILEWPSDPPLDYRVVARLFWPGFLPGAVLEVMTIDEVVGRNKQLYVGSVRGGVKDGVSVYYFDPYPSEEHGYGIETEVAAATDFRQGFVEAVRLYIEREKALPRSYPNPTRTADTDNGYIFANWTQDKYGLAEAR